MNTSCYYFLINFINPVHKMFKCNNKKAKLKIQDENPELEKDNYKLQTVDN